MYIIAYMHSCFDSCRFLRVNQRNWRRDWRGSLKFSYSFKCCLWVYSDSVQWYQSLCCVGRLERKMCAYTGVCTDIHIQCSVESKHTLSSDIVKTVYTGKMCCIMARKRPSLSTQVEGNLLWLSSSGVLSRGRQECDKWFRVCLEVCSWGQF